MKQMDRRDFIKSAAATAGMMAGFNGRILSAGAATLPYAPRTSWDIIVDLNKTDIRTFQNATYRDKHVRVIPKRTVDRNRGLLFNACASVTIIGGHFRPPVDGYARYDNGDKGDGIFTFTSCGEVYLEGVLLDNIDVSRTYADGLYLNAKKANTILTMQNCRFQNVMGLEASFHNDILQAGSKTMGITQEIRLYNFTGTCDYQGFFFDPQTDPGYVPPGRVRKVKLQNVNLRRSQVITPYPRLYFWYDNEIEYTMDGGTYPTPYPIKLENVWANSVQGTVLDAVWPSNTAGSKNQFPTQICRAVRTLDGATGRYYASWPGMQGAGKAISNFAVTEPGRIWEGDPPGGDFVLESSVGLNYRPYV